MGNVLMCVFHSTYIIFGGNQVEQKEYYGTYHQNGNEFVFWRKWSKDIPDHLECFVDGKLYARTKRFNIEPIDFVCYCLYNYKKEN